MGTFVLTDIHTRKAQPRNKDYKPADTGGLYLFVTARGSKSWRLKYRFAGKEKRLVFGQYLEISLSAARDLRDEARREVREHRDAQACRRSCGHRDLWSEGLSEPAMLLDGKRR